MPAFGPLAGIRVVDTGRLVAGPWAATYLGEFGAEVIHVEGAPFRRPYADPTRTLPPTLPEGRPSERSVSESWVQYGRNKLSVGLDFARPSGRDVLLDLLRRADIWVESSRPGTYDRLGLGDAVVRSAAPRLVIVHVSGYGQSGVPARIGSAAFDLTAQAYSGFLALQGEPAPAPPTRAGTALSDTVTGLAAAAAAMMGWASVQRTGAGQVVDVAQYEVLFTLLENLALDYFARGVVRGRFGSGHARLSPYDLLPARDGWVVLAAPTPQTWARFRPLLGPLGPEWEEMSWRTAHREEVVARLTAFAQARSVAELEELGRAHDVAIQRVNSIAEAAADPHFRAREMFLEWVDPVAGRVKGAGIAPKFLGTPGAVWRGAPWLGQDNERVLSEGLGYSRARIAELRATGVLGEDPPTEPTGPDPEGAEGVGP